MCMGWTMVNKMNEMDYGRQNEWNGQWYQWGDKNNS